MNIGMHRSIFTGFFILVLLVTSRAQWVVYQPDEPLVTQPLFQDSIHNQLNFYDLSGNIAALLYDERAFSLWTGGNFGVTSGKYHTALSPGSANNQQFFFQLLKPLTARDIFKGYFGFQRQEDQALRWIHQSRQLETNTFILGDSSSGDFVLNGIFWNGEWAHAFSPSLAMGMGMYYNVDRRLKQNFPKPENQHRDIQLRGGIQQSWKNFQAGLAFRYFDQQEKVEVSRYNLDQNLTPVLYKFRFSDLPVILLGKTSEERQIDYQGFYLDAHLLRKLSAKTTVIGAVTFSGSNGEVVDGGSQPQNQGSFERDDWEGRILMRHQHSANFTLQMKYQFSYRNFTARPPDFDITAIKHPLLGHQLSLNLKTKTANSSQLFADLIYRNIFEEFQDLMSENYYQYQYHRGTFRAGWNGRLTNRWDSRLWGSVDYYTFYNHSRSDNRYTLFFDQLFIRTYEYLTGRNVDLGGGVQVVYHYGPLFDTEITVGYLHWMSATDFLPNASRQNLILKMMLKFYIL